MSAITKLRVEPPPSSAPASPAPKAGLFRRTGLIVLGGILGLAVGYLTLFLDADLKDYLERYGRLINGARVDIASVHTSLWKRQIELRGIQLARNSDPMRNWLEINRVTIHFLPAPLLAKKLIITNLEIEGLRHNTSRNQSGLDVTDTGEPAPAFGLLDRASSTLYPQLGRRQMNNPLGRLAQFSVGLDVQTKFNAKRDKLQSLRAMEEIRSALDAEVDRWEATRLMLPSASWLADARIQIQRLIDTRLPAAVESHPSLSELREQITSARENASRTFAAVEQRTAALETRLREIDAMVEQDAVSLRDTLGLPSLRRTDLTPLIFGPHAINYLDRLSYWLDFSRRRMPKGSRNGQLILAGGDPVHGLLLHFGKNSAYPSLLIEHGTITSDPGSDVYGGKVRGSFEGITSDPPIYQHPARLTLDADFPGQNITGLHLDVLVDHSVDNSHENVELTVKSFPVTQWAIHDGSDLAITIQRGIGRVHFKGQFDDATAHVDWDSAIENIDYRVMSPYQQLQDTLQGIFAQVPDVRVTGSLAGPAATATLKLESNLGRELATALRTQFKVPMEAIDDSLRKFLLDEVDDPRRILAGKVREFRARWEPVAQERMKELDDLLALTDPATSHRQRTAGRQ